MKLMTSMPAPIAALLSLILGLLLSGTLAAQSLNDTVRRVERETGGRILSAETVVSGSREVYRIKVLTPDGRVRVVQEPAPAGRATSPRSREAPRRDGNPERSERDPFARPERAEPPPAFAPRERGYVPRQERSREAAPPRGAPRESQPALRDRQGQQRGERRDDN